MLNMELNLIASLCRTTERISLLYGLLSRHEDRTPFRLDNYTDATKAAWIKTVCAMAARRDHLIHRLSSEFDIELSDLYPA